MFDIGHKVSESQTLVKIVEDRLFLEDLREVSKMVMAIVDEWFSAQEEWPAHRRLKEHKQKGREEQRKY